MIRDSWKVKRDIQYLGGTTVKATNETISQIMSTLDESMSTAAADESSPSDPNPNPVDTEAVAAVPTGTTTDGGEEDGNPQTNKLLILLQEKLPECTNQAKADEFSVSFCYATTKNARKKVTEALFRVPRTRYELIPNYARIVASLSRIYPNMGVVVVESLFKEFYGIFKAKTPLYLENKIKNVRYIGELVKFGVAAPIIAFKVFNLLLTDFTDHSIDMFAALLESCGRYLYVLSFTNQRISGIIDTMQRLRKLKKLDLWKQNILDSAYFTVKPPVNSLKTKKEYTKIQKFIRYIFFEKLSSGTPVFQIVKLLRKLPWIPIKKDVVVVADNVVVEGTETTETTVSTETNVEEDVDIEEFVIKTCLKVCRTKYIDIRLVAKVVFGISK